jgi:hypothetical protein
MECKYKSREKVRVVGNTRVGGGSYHCFPLGVVATVVRVAFGCVYCRYSGIIQALKPEHIEPLEERKATKK